MTQMRTTIVLSFLVGTACSSRSPERIAPTNAGPRPRECVQGPTKPDSAWPADSERSARWSAAFSNEINNTSFGQLEIDFRYWVVGDNAYLRDACVETKGVPQYMALHPNVDALEFQDPEKRVFVRIRVRAELQGSAERGGAVPDHPRARVTWTIEATPNRATVKYEPAQSDKQFRPPWGKARVTVKESDVVVGR